MQIMRAEDADLLSVRYEHLEAKPRDTWKKKTGSSSGGYFESGR